MTLSEIVERTIGHEGRYSNNPNDSGGETMWGITLAEARRNGYTAPMREMPRDTAIRIYINKYLREPGIDKINDINSRVCFEVYDTGVNCGPQTAIEFLQKSLNILNRQGQDYADLIVDGVLGRKTLAAMETFLTRRKLEGELVLLKVLNVYQGAYYLNLAERRQKDEAFIFGWFRTRIDLNANSL